MGLRRHPNGIRDARFKSVHETGGGVGIERRQRERERLERLDVNRSVNRIIAVSRLDLVTHCVLFTDFGT